MKKQDQKNINSYNTNRCNFIKKAAAIGLTTTFSVPYVSSIFAATSNHKLIGGKKINWEKEWRIALFTPSDQPIQAPSAGPDLNCCSVNAYRPLGMISEWALKHSGDGTVLNFYRPGKMTMLLPSNNQMTIAEDLEYPVEGVVKLALTLKKPETFTLKLRIPFWSATTVIKINEKAISEKTEPGSYLSVKRLWKSGDQIELTLDFKLRFWYDDEVYKGKVSVFRGSILLTYDARFNKFDLIQIPVLEVESLVFERQKFSGSIEPGIYGVLKDKKEAIITVCDFSSA